MGADDSENEAGTPSFSMITLIHENDWLIYITYIIIILQVYNTTVIFFKFM